MAALILKSQLSEKKDSPLNLVSPVIYAPTTAWADRLVDPRNLETFYVGKGSGDRALMHARGDRRLKRKGKDDPAKLARISEIRRAGRSPIVFIHRHGLADEVALEVEAALMDAYPGLSNVATGKGADRRAVTIDDFLLEHAAPVAAFTKDEPCLAVAIHRTLTETNRTPYDCVRFAWRLDRTRVKQVKYVLAINHGLIVGVFKPTKWLRARNMTEFPGHNRRKLRNLLGFEGGPAPKDVWDRYFHHRIPPRKRGDRSRFHYLP